MKKITRKEQSGNTDNREVKAKKTLSKLNKRIIGWSCFGVFTLACLTGIGTIKLMSTGELYEITDMFYPKTVGIVDLTNETDAWQTVNFTHLNYDDGNVTEEKNSYFEYKTIFINKNLVNDANNSGEIEVRVLDEDGNVVVEPTTVNSGTNIPVKNLKINTKYTVECRNGSGRYRINLC